MNENAVYIRRLDKDKRIGRGDDFAADAWQCAKTGRVRLVAVGPNPNTGAANE